MIDGEKNLIRRAVVVHDMSNSRLTFLQVVAKELRDLAERAPDISAELRGFALDLDHLAEEPFPDGASPEVA